MRELWIILESTFVPTVQRTTLQYLPGLMLHTDILFGEGYGNGLKRLLLCQTMSAEVLQMSVEVVGLSGDGVWVSEVACKPVAQGSRQP